MRAFVAFASAPITSEARVARADDQLGAELSDKQREFVEFVLAQYVKQGVDELNLDKLSPLLKLEYKAIADATVELGEPRETRELFTRFQFLYEERKAA